MTSAPGFSHGSRRVRRARKSACRGGQLPRCARPVQLATSRTPTTILADLSADFCPTRALFLAKMSVGDARMYTCTCCSVHDKLSCTCTFTKLHDKRIPDVGVGVCVVPVVFQLN